MIIEISVAVVAIAFAALVVFLIQTLRSVSDLLGQTNMVIRELQEQMNGISTEAVELLRHTNEVSVDVRNKLHSIDSVVDSVKKYRRRRPGSYFFGQASVHRGGGNDSEQRTERSEDGRGNGSTCAADGADGDRAVAEVARKEESGIRPT